MKLDSDPFPVNTINLEGNKVLIRSSQAESTKGKEVIIGEEHKPKMMKPKNPEVGCWKVNEQNKAPRKPKVTFDLLLDKYQRGKAGQ